MEVDAVGDAERGGQSVSGAISGPLPARSRRHSMRAVSDGLARSSSTSARSIQSMRLLASILQTESMRSSPATGRMRKMPAGSRYAETAHARDVSVDAEISCGTRAQVFAGDDRVAAAAQAAAR